LKIADGWRNIDAECRQFCAELCALGLLDYKRAMRAYRMEESRNGMVSPPSTSLEDIKANKSVNKMAEIKLKSNPSDVTVVPNSAVMMNCLFSKDEPHMGLPLLDALFDEHSSNITMPALPLLPALPPLRHVSNEELDTTFEKDMELYFNHFDANGISTSSVANVTEGGSRRTSTESFVDMNDDEIINMWKSEDAGNVPQVATSAQFAFATNGTVPRNAFCVFISQTNQQFVKSTVTAVKSNTSSFTKTTLQDMMAMKEMLSEQQSQLQTAARRLSDQMTECQRRHRQQQRNSFVACSA